MLTIEDKAKTLKTDKEILKFIANVVWSQKNIETWDMEFLLVDKAKISTKRARALIEEWLDS